MQQMVAGLPQLPFPSLLAPIAPKSSGSCLSQGFGAWGIQEEVKVKTKHLMLCPHEMLSFSCALFEGHRGAGTVTGH